MTPDTNHQSDFDAPSSPDQDAAVEAFGHQDFSPGGPGDGADAAAIAQATADHAGGKDA
jgi:hypothetical protein